MLVNTLTNVNKWHLIVKFYQCTKCCLFWKKTSLIRFFFPKRLSLHKNIVNSCEKHRCPTEISSRSDDNPLQLQMESTHKHMDFVAARCLLSKCLPALAIQLLLLFYDALAYLLLELHGLFFSIRSLMHFNLLILSKVTEKYSQMLGQHIASTLLLTVTTGAHWGYNTLHYY